MYLIVLLLWILFENIRTSPSCLNFMNSIEVGKSYIFENVTKIIRCWPPFSKYKICYYITVMNDVLILNITYKWKLICNML